jgi:hypothetical protein
MRLALDARTAAFGSLIDYAGTFPPASLPMDEAVETFRRIRGTPNRWVMGRFLCRASELERLAAVATGSLRRGEPPWSIGVIFDITHGAAAALGQEFQREMAPIMSVASAEARATPEAPPGALIDAMATIDPDITAFIEVDTAANLKEQIRGIGTALRERGRPGGAKLRCGGTTPEAFPTVDDVASFIWETSGSSMPFKATAGLHHPVRHHDEGLGVWRHGFVNILLASVACDAGESRSTVEQIVAETDPDAFAIGTMAASWRDVSLPGAAIARSRRSGFTAFGSCDVDEPLAELTTHSFLGDGA